MCSREMKDSGIEWIGYVPNEWYLEKLKNLYSFEKGKNAALYTQEYIGTHKGEYPVYSGQTENDGIMGNIDTYDYEENECLFTTTVGAKVMTPRVIKGKFSLSQNCLIMKSNNNSSIKFIYYMLNPLFNYEKSLIPAYMQPSLRVSDLRRYQFYVPNIEEQQQIVNYLDKKVSQIDDIISKQKSLIEKYKAYKQSLITETVTKGLNKNVPMKDSGIEWIGEIPNHWNVEKMKYLIDFNPNYSENLNENVNVSFVPMECIGNGYMRYKEVELKDVKGKYTYFSDKDIIMAKVTPCFENGNIAIANDLINRVGFGSSELYVFRCKKVDNKFMFYYLRNNIFKEGCISTMTGTGGLKRVSASFIENYYIGIPEIDEQREIAEFLDKKCKAIDSAISKKEKLIEKLESYKKSLIYECVTGKREVN